MTGRRDNVTSITLRQVYLMSTFLIRFATSQSSSYHFSLRLWVDPVSFSTFKIVKIPGIELPTSWLLVTHANHSTNEAVILLQVIL